MIWDENAKVKVMITHKQGGAISISLQQQSSHSSFLALPKSPFNYLTTAKLIHLFSLSKKLQMSFLSSEESWIIDKSNMHANLYLWFSLLSSLGGEESWTVT